MSGRSASGQFVRQVCRWFLLAGTLLAAWGVTFAPWVSRPAAALALTAPDLAEFVKFLPEVRANALPVERLFFLAPLFLITVSIPFIATSRRLNYPRPVRWLALAATIPLALQLLPPVWSPAVLSAPEFRLQTAGCLISLGLVVVSRWLPQLQATLLAGLPPLLWWAGTVAALYQFFLVQPAVSSAYSSRIRPGWGIWLTLVGLLLLTVCWLQTSFFLQKAKPQAHRVTQP